MYICVHSQRRARHGTARAGALRARAEYVLSLEAANATLQRYYLDDIADIILVSFYGCRIHCTDSYLK